MTTICQLLIILMKEKTVNQQGLTVRRPPWDGGKFGPPTKSAIDGPVTEVMAGRGLKLYPVTRGCGWGLVGH